MTTFQLSPEGAARMEATTNADWAHPVLWHYSSPGAMEPGSFRKALVEACVRADPINLARLSSGFPEVTAAVALAQGRADGIARLRRVAGLPEVPAVEETDLSINPSGGR